MQPIISRRLYHFLPDGNLTQSGTADSRRLQSTVPVFVAVSIRTTRFTRDYCHLGQFKSLVGASWLLGDQDKNMVSSVFEVSSKDVTMFDEIAEFDLTQDGPKPRK